jgi:hypothetical protein
MKKASISEILWKAANEYLTHPEWCVDGSSPYSCDAIGVAAETYERSVEVVAFIRRLGFPERGPYFAEFEGEGEYLRERMTEDSQEVRYAWLMFASMYAEEQGL